MIDCNGIRDGESHCGTLHWLDGSFWHVADGLGAKLTARNRILVENRAVRFLVSPKHPKRTFSDARNVPVADFFVRPL